MVPKICSIPECGKHRSHRDWCPMHYQRWKNHGSPLWEPPVKPTTCSVESCGRPRTKRDYCNMHYIRWRTKGDVGPAETVINVQSGDCSALGCAEKAKTRGRCSMHHSRFARTGSLDDPMPRSKERNGAWKGDAASYFAIHQRLKVERGKASGYSCVECGKRACHWAYDNADPNEREDDGGRYSTDIGHYQPMCVSCHRKFDFNHSKKKESV